MIRKRYQSTKTATFAGSRSQVVFLILNSLDQCKFIFDGRKIKAFISNPQILFNYFRWIAYSIVNVHKTGQWSEGYRWFCVSVITP